MSFATKLRELRDAKKWNQDELAAASGIPQGTIANFEQGRRRPSFAVAVKLANALGVDCREFANALSEDDEEEKRPRGRPSSKPASEEPAEKKPRGRPRKNSDAPESAAEPEPGKGKKKGKG